MQLLFRCLLGIAVLVAGFTQSARADDANTAYIVTYIETTPPAASRVAAMLRALGNASRKDEGNLGFVVLQRIGQRNQFAIIEAWRDKDAQGNHATAAHTQKLREELQPLLRSPYDERPHTGLAVGTPRKGKAKGAEVYAVTHVDVVPTEKEKGIGIVKDLAEAGRNDDGNLRFDALQQNSRPNHMTVVEEWRNMKAVDAHGMAAHKKSFREKLTPMSGSLYDERLYKALN